MIKCYNNGCDKFDNSLKNNCRTIINAERCSGFEPEYSLEGERKEIVNDTINPQHYLKYKILPTTFIMENGLGFAEGNVIKYVCRYEDKNGLEDLKKAYRYLELLMEQKYNYREFKKNNE